MLKRLISAVFVLSLVLALSGTAISDVVKGELNPVIKVNPNHDRFVNLADARPEQPAFRKPESALKQLPGGMTAPTPPQTYFCDVEDYTNGVPYYYWPIPDVYGDDLFNMRFTSIPDYYCTLMVADYLMYGTVMVGTPDMRCFLWDDDGFGFPFAKLDSVDILNASLPTSGIAYVAADFTPAGNASGNWWVFTGEKYHYGWTILGSPGDTLAIISDDATGPYVGEERSSEFCGGMWGTMLNDWGIDVSFFILSERCCGEIPYTDCYWQYYYTNVAYLWRAPHPVYGDLSYAMRHSVKGAETLQVVDVAIYDDGTGNCGNDDVIITIYDDAGGLPGAQIAQVVKSPPYAFFPSWERFTFNLVLIPGYNITMNDFHIAFSSSAIPGSGDYEACLSSDGTDGVGRSTCDEGGWIDMLTCWGLDANFLFDAYLCKDEFYECAWNWCYVSLDWFWRLPDAYGDYAHAQKFHGEGKECRVHDVCWYLYDNGDPNIYTTQSEIQVYSDAGGLPGAKRAGITIGPGSGIPYQIFPAAMCVDFEPLNVYVTGDYWVGIESFGTDETDGIRTLSDNGGGGCVDGLAENYAGAWELLYPYWGGGMPQDIAGIVEAFHCCIPYTGRICEPTGEDWYTYQHDYARTGASLNPVGDAWCDLTLNWAYEDPSSGVSFCGPIIAYDKVTCSFSDHYITFDLATGMPIYTLPYDGTMIGSSIRSTPTVATIAGYPDPVLFASGGSSFAIMAYDYNTGALIWSRDLGTVGPSGVWGTTRWGRFTVVNLSAIDYVFWGTDDGKVVGVDALTGVLMPGYPVDLSYSTYVSGVTDGENLFFGTFATGVEGDLYSINAATGGFNWQLSVPPAAGLQGPVVWTHANGYNNDEGFTAGISYENGVIYANSRAEADHPTDGLFYRLNSTNGMLVGSATIANRAYYQTPIIDVNHVYMPSLTRWVGAPAGGNMYAVKKSSGAIERTFTSASGGRYYVDGILTCEPEPEPDLLYVFNEDGFLSCVNAVTFEEVYRRRIDHGGGTANLGMAGAIAPDPGTGETHVLFATYWGDLFDMTKQVDRPRLQIQTYSPMTAVEFGPATSLPVSIPDVYVNTGCANLNFISVTADEVNPGTTIPDFASANTVDPSFMDRAASIADKLARDAFLSKYLRPNENVLDENNMVSVREMDLNKERINRAAAGFPPYLNSVVHPAAGDVLTPTDPPMAIDLDVIQTAINRGPQCFYLSLETDDPDFFLNNVTMQPVQHVCLVGGCLIDSTTLYFGVGPANEQLVTNTGRLGTGDWGDGPAGYNCFLIDGDGASYYQGAYVYAVSTHRVAVHTQDWTSGGGEIDAFVSMQPDPNWCDDACKPYLDAGVSLGEMTTDGGLNYTTVTGDMVCKSFLDSVQNFDLGGGWDWENFGAPFDNDSTMGLYCNGRVVGAVGVPELANLTLEILEFTERNGDSVKGWYLSEIWDCDVGGDSATMDASISAGWAYNRPAEDAAWGQIKIPFGGCGYEPLINYHGFAGVSGTPGNGFWGWGIFWDSCYNWMQYPPGFHAPDAGQMTTSDAEAMATLAKKDFGPNETYIIGVAHFGLSGLTDATDPAEIAPLAHMVNKWAGFGRGDVNNDGSVDLADIIYLAATVNGGPGAVPFKHLSDVNNDSLIDMADVNYLIAYYFDCGPCPVGNWIF